MSRAEVLAKLQSLLARVQARAALGRSSTESSSPLEAGAPPTREDRSVARLSEPQIRVDVNVEVSTWTPPPPDLAIDVELDTASPSVPSESTTPPAVHAEAESESAERLVAASPFAPPAGTGEPGEAVVRATLPGGQAMFAAAGGDLVEQAAVARESEPSEVEASPEFDHPDPGLEPALEASVAGADGEQDEGELDQPAPASSRRLVTATDEQHLSDMAFGSDGAQPPRRTAPRESGRLPAPGVDDFESEVTGMHHAASPASEPRVPAAPRPALVPDEVRAELTEKGDVAQIVSEAQRFAPETFLALLDASLGL